MLYCHVFVQLFPHSKFFCRYFLCENLCLPINGCRGIVTCPTCEIDVCDRCFPVGNSQCKHCTPDYDAESDTSNDDNEDDAATDNIEQTAPTYEEVGQQMMADYVGLRIAKSSSSGKVHGFDAQVALPRQNGTAGQVFTVGSCGLAITALIGYEILAFILGRVPLQLGDIHSLKIAYQEQMAMLQSVALPELVKGRTDVSKNTTFVFYLCLIPSHTNSC